MIKTPSFMGYTKPGRLVPEWYTGYLVFQGGNPRQRTGSLTGGGQVYGHEYAPLFEPVIQAYSTPVTNLVAGGQIPSNPSFLQALFGGARGHAAGNN
jgi:hypothetical protein